MSRKPAAPGDVPANPQEAFRKAVFEYPGGVEKLAARLVMNRGTLYNKCDAEEGSHNQPTLRDVVRVTRETGNFVILDSLERMFNRAAYDVTPGLEVSDKALLELICRVSSEHGAMHQALARGLEDKRFTDEELKAVRAEAFDLITATLTFLHRLEGLVDA